MYGSRPVQRGSRRGRARFFIIRHGKWWPAINIAAGLMLLCNAQSPSAKQASTLFARSSWQKA
jgi:hypothetical protein